MTTTNQKPKVKYIGVKCLICRTCGDPIAPWKGGTISADRRRCTNCEIKRRLLDLEELLARVKRIEGILRRVEAGGAIEKDTQ